MEVQRALGLAPASSVNHVGVRGWTPLYAACARGHVDVVAILLKWGADPELPTQSQWRPLMTAAQQGFKEIVKLLLEHSANPAAKNNNGDTALALARNAGKHDVVGALEVPTEVAMHKVAQERSARRMSKVGQAGVQQNTLSAAEKAAVASSAAAKTAAGHTSATGRCNSAAGVVAPAAASCGAPPAASTPAQPVRRSGSVSSGTGNGSWNLASPGVTKM